MRTSLATAVSHDHTTYTTFISHLQRQRCPLVVYCRGGLTDQKKGGRHILLLAASASISWVFAKSILNASLLGGEYGIVGGLAYGTYVIAATHSSVLHLTLQLVVTSAYCLCSFLLHFICICGHCDLLDTRKGYRSLPEAINERYGSMATLAFGLAVLFRLYQEVWSNALVVAGFYGEEVGQWVQHGCCAITCCAESSICIQNADCMMI